MLVERSTRIVKSGKTDEAVALVKAEEARIREAYNFTGAVRHYVNQIGPFNRYVIEMEWNSLAEYEAFWADWFASSEAPAFLEKFDPLIESGESKMWRLVE